MNEEQTTQQKLQQSNTIISYALNDLLGIVLALRTVGNTDLANSLERIAGNISMEVNDISDMVKCEE